MINMNNNFRKAFSRQDEYLQYKGRMPLFVINYEPTMATEMDYNKYKLIRLEAIKSIYINEDISTMCKYADPRISPLEIDKIYGCVVFVETYPEDKIPTDAGKGVRKTWLEGYSQVKEFYSPDIQCFLPNRITDALYTGIPPLLRMKKAKPVSGSTITADAGSSR